MSRRRQRVQHRPLVSEQFCEVCQRPSPDGVLVCSGCMDVFHGQVARLLRLFADLEVEYLRQSVKTIGGQGHFEAPLMFGAAASELIAEGRRLLAGHCLGIARPWEEPPGRDAPIGAFAAFLAGHERAVPTHRAGPLLVADLDAFTDRANSLCDLPPDRRYVGDCVCGEKLWASEPVVTCRCGQAWDAEIRQAQMEQNLRDTLLTLAEVEVATGGRIKAKTVQKWIERKRLRRNRRGRVRFGDVLGLEGGL